MNGDQTVLKLVPANRLQAKVEITDGDIGFVKVGLPVNVAVDSFPSGEFGYIQGTLTSLGLMLSLQMRVLNIVFPAQFR